MLRGVHGPLAAQPMTLNLCSGNGNDNSEQRTHPAFICKVAAK